MKENLIRKVRKPPKEFGDESTIDHWIARDELSHGFGGGKVALTFRDRASSWIDCWGMTANTFKRTCNAVRHIVGSISSDMSNPMAQKN